MDSHVDKLQRMFESNDVLRYTYEELLPFDDLFANRVIRFHEQPQVWASNIIMEMTAVMLKTRYYLYSRNGIWQGLDDGHHPFWSSRDEFTSYPTGIDSTKIPPLSEQSMYINHKNGNHFEVCHGGLQRRM